MTAASTRALRFATHEVERCDAFLRSVGWEVVYNQLSPGRYAVEIEGVVAPAAQVLVHRHVRAFAGRGETPPHAYTFGLQLAGQGALTVCQRTIRPHEIALQLPRDSIDFSLPPAVTLLTVAAAADRADRLADAMFGQPLRRLARRDNALPCDVGAGARLGAWVSAIAAQGAAHDSAAAAARFDDAVLDALLHTLRPPEPIRGWSARRRIVRRAEEMIEDDARAPATIAELCVALAVPVRTLEDAFRHCLGVSPRTYLAAMRLNRVRRLLSRPPAGISVTEAATRFGFFHLGRFSEQYRRLFGELPSDTLRRALS